MSTKDEWRQRVREWRRSGASCREFCQGKPYSEASLYAWARQLRDERVEPAASPGPLRFVRVVTPARAPSSLTIELGAGRIVVDPSTDLTLLARVLDAVGAHR